LGQQEYAKTPSHLGKDYQKNAFSGKKENATSVKTPSRKVTLPPRKDRGNGDHCEKLALLQQCPAAGGRGRFTPREIKWKNITPWLRPRRVGGDDVTKKGFQRGSELLRRFPHRILNLLFTVIKKDPEKAKKSHRI